MGISAGADDWGLLYGFSLFETFLVGGDGAVFLLDAHLRRLTESANVLGLAGCPSTSDLGEAVRVHIEQESMGRGRAQVLRLTVTAGNPTKAAPPSVTCSQRDNPYTATRVQAGCSLVTSVVHRNETSLLLRHKTANCLENLLALNAAVGQGHDDVLFLNSRGAIAETAKCNIFFVSDGVLHTPAVHCGLLPGVMRMWVLREAPVLGIPFAQGQYSYEQLAGADEAFVTNSVMGVMHVPSIDGARVGPGSGPGPVARLLAQLLARHMALR